MKYENELIELIPMLKNYIKKMQKKYQYLIDVEDIMQECLIKAIESTKKQKIKHPTYYFMGLFKKVIYRMIDNEFKRQQLIKKLENTKKIITSERLNIGKDILDELNKRIDNCHKSTQRVWECLKVFKGDYKRISEYLGLTVSGIKYHKRKIRPVYKNIKEFV